MTTNDVIEHLETRLREILPKADRFLWFEASEETAVQGANLKLGELVILIGYGADDEAFQTASTVRRASSIELTISILKTVSGTVSKDAIRDLNDAMDIMIAKLPPTPGEVAWFTKVGLKGVEIDRPFGVPSLLGEWVARRVPIRIIFER